MENNNNKDVLNIINEEINFILNKVFILIEENEKINEEKCDADIKFNTLNLDDIISQVNNSNNNIFPSFDNIILSNSMNNFNNDAFKSFTNYSYKDLANFLDTLNPYEFTLISIIAAFLIAPNLKLDEQYSVGNFFLLLGQTIITINSQEVLVNKNTKNC